MIEKSSLIVRLRCDLPIRQPSGLVYKYEVLRAAQIAIIKILLYIFFLKAQNIILKEFSKMGNIVIIKHF